MDPRRLPLASHLLLALLLLPSASVRAANLVSVTVNPTNIVSGSPLEETVTLDGPAPAGGVYVSVTSNTPSVVTTFSIGLAAGETSQSVVLPPTGYVAPATGTVVVTITASYAGIDKSTTVTVTPREPIRGAAGDLWADVILGKPDFGEVTFNEVTSRRVFNPGGVTVDRSVRPNRLYVFDATNSRVLGLSHLGTCAGGTKAGLICTTNSDCPSSTCTIQEGRGADLVLGQPSFNSSACNGDGAFQRYPLRAPASATTLCGVPEEQMSISEGVIYANMAVDSSGNFYVPDFLNHRVLRYDSPFTTNTIADDVWGQTDFVQNDCNRGNGLISPDAQSLCFAGPNNSFTAGVDIDSHGNLWVADHQNNRVLRFPFDSLTHRPSHTADLVLGQQDFTSSGQGADLNQMWGPAAVRVDGAGTVYVADLRNNRVLIFSPPISSGMTAGLLDYTVNGHSFFEPSGLELDPSSGGLWVNDWLNNHLLLFVGGVLQKILFTDVPTSEGCGGSFAGDIYPGYFIYADGSSISNWRMCESGGSIGIDSDGNVFASGKEAQDVWRFPAPFPTPTEGIAHSADARIFKPYEFGIQNEVGPAGFQSANGVAVAEGQLIVADGKRLLYWNYPPNLANGQPADGFVGQDNATSLEGWRAYGRIREDGSKRLWAIHSDEILVYSLPLQGEDSPVATFVSPLPVLGGGTLTWNETLLIGGIQPVGTGDKVWVADPVRNRVFRIRDAFTNPTVDIVLGQTSPSGTDCNQGRGMVSGAPTRDSLCYPGAVRLDPQGNLYVSDDSAEVQGNFRLLEYDAALFPDSPSSAVFAILASRVFGTGGSFTLWPDGSHEFWSAAFEPAFTPDGQMVVGGNGYLNPRFPYIYTQPLVNQHVGTFLNDFYSWPGAATFDASGNLYVTDGNRGRLLIYLTPFASAPPPPSVTGISPDTGSTAGGTPVTITGTGFQSGAMVSLGGVAATGVVVTPPDTITATTGAHAAGSVDVVVTNPDGRSGTLTSGFLYVVPPPAPTIRSFTPTSGIAGASVTISGTNFTGATAVKFNGASATYSVNSAVSITASVPANATTGKITVTTPGGTATSTGNFTVRPSISGFTPGSGAVGISVTITGSAFGGATAVKFHGTTAGFTVDSSIQITATVPAGATTGTITVTTPVGTATSATAFIVAPRITSFSPASGLIGASVTIYGANFTGATSVTFNGTSATYTVNSATRITATVPSGATTGPIGVATPAGTATSTGNFSIKPSITGFTPGGGAVGISVTITGIAFGGATAVKFHGTTAGFTVDSGTQITAIVPAGATTGTITVTTPVGTATSATAFIVAPRITSFSPTSGLIGARITIYGANLTGATTVTFNGTSATYTVNSATRITATVPSGATTGPIGVATPAGTATSTGNFSIKPSITGFTPGGGAVGISVTITGIAFGGATAVKFHGTTAGFTVDSGTQITATVPAGATTGTITVTTPVGTATSTTAFIVAPRITSFSPTSGLIGASVTIYGANFAGATTVTFNGTSATYTVNSATRITATVPGGATAGQITVTTSAGTGTSSSSFTVK